MIYDIDKIKQELTIEQISELVAEFGGEPIIKGDVIISRTICHNPKGEGSHKLYYYDNTKLFHCYTGCSEPSFDIMTLTQKVKEQELGEYSLPQAIDYVAKYFGFSPDFSSIEEDNLINEDLKYLQEYDRIKNIIIETQEVELKEYNDDILKNLPHPTISDWIADGISKEIMNFFEICYDPKNCGIVIPHRDINKRLVGIRERTLIEENIEKYGKYRPALLGGKLYRHPLSFNLYGLCQNQNQIRTLEKVFVFESEKSVLQYGTMFGQENNIAVAVCGSSFIAYQFWLLIKLGVKEIIICLDKQYQEIGDAEFKKLIKNLKNIHKKYGKFVTISIIFDKWDLLDYKMSPTDKDKETFLKLFHERINLY